MNGEADRWPYPSVWLACGVLFATNAVISAFRHDWWLVALQLVTAGLALLSARWRAR